MEVIPYAMPVTTGSSPGRRLIVWLLILLAGAIMILDNRWSAERRGTAGIEQVNVELQSRYTVGFVHTFTSLTAAQRHDSIRQLEKNAKTASSRIAVAIVSGEIEDEPSAKAQLEKLDQEHLSGSERADVAILRQIDRDGAQSITASQRDELHNDLGWFGDLAASRKLSDSDPLRARTLHAATRAFYLMLGSVLGVGLLFLVGIALLIFFAVLKFDRSLAPLFRRAQPPIADCLLEGFAAYLLGMAMLSLVARRLAGLGLSANVLLIMPILLAFAWLWGRGINWSELQNAVGWHRGRGVLREMGCGIVGYITAIPLLVAGLVLTLLLVRWTGSQPPTHPIVEWMRSSLGVQIFVVFLACVFAPVVEELVFRGMLLGHLRLRHGWLVSALATSVIFAGIHPQGWLGIPVLAAIAMVLAALREQRGSLIASMTAHAINNGALMMLLFFALR